MADGAEQREEFARVLVKWMRDEAPLVDADVMIMGDFNAPPNDPCWRPFHQLENDGKAKFQSINDPSDFSVIFGSKTQPASLFQKLTSQCLVLRLRSASSVTLPGRCAGSRESQRTVQICLFIMAAIALFGGVLQMSLGQPDTTPRLDNVHRFLAGIYRLRLIAAWAAITVRRQGTLIYLIALGVALGGFGRVVSMAKVGLPEPHALWIAYVALISRHLFSAASRRSSATSCETSSPGIRDFKTLVQPGYPRGAAQVPVGRLGIGAAGAHEVARGVQSLDGGFQHRRRGIVEYRARPPVGREPLHEGCVAGVAPSGMILKSLNTGLDLPI